MVKKEPMWEIAAKAFLAARLLEEVEAAGYKLTDFDVDQYGHGDVELDDGRERKWIPVNRAEVETVLWVARESYGVPSAAPPMCEDCDERRREGWR
jgi:hypothetical protein